MGAADPRTLAPRWLAFPPVIFPRLPQCAGSFGCGTPGSVAAGHPPALVPLANRSAVCLCLVSAFSRGRSRHPALARPAATPAMPHQRFSVFAAALLFPALLIQEAAPDWSVANWSLAITATITTLLYLRWTGGTRWACCFLFPSLSLTAIPWPQRFDLWLTQGLMRKVAAIRSLSWLAQYTRLLSGNLICCPPAPSVSMKHAAASAPFRRC